ncbi:hypothetical protein DPMN_067229 [Dreissena polymorpha]|uniref:Uncharacterized protein n=1 Tax=Dreissena polymorpha TaxID=45954 RepID=A0A9D3YUX2_DREPO|nr:hypothetical protein DPMN_067229 [Dreissena polymorpha]
MEIFAIFQEYVRPFLNPKLPSFCTSLTGIHTGKSGPGRSLCGCPCQGGGMVLTAWPRQ